MFFSTSDTASSFTGIQAATNDGVNYSLAWRESTGPASLDDTRVLFTFTNNTGEPISGFDVSYDVEAWVNGRRDNQLRFTSDVYADSAAAQAAEGRNAFETDIFATVNPNHTPIATNGDQFVLDGKDTANRTTVSGFVDLTTLLVDETDPGLGFFGELLPGGTAYFRWQISNAFLTDGNRSALAIDNLSITPLAASTTAAAAQVTAESSDFAAITPDALDLAADDLPGAWQPVPSVTSHVSRSPATSAAAASGVESHLLLLAVANRRADGEWYGLEDDLRGHRSSNESQEIDDRFALLGDTQLDSLTTW